MRRCWPTPCCRAWLAPTRYSGTSTFNNKGLASALNEFARQSDRQILFSTEAAGTKHTDGVMGDLAPDAALRILLQGTGLSFRVTSDNTILIEQTHDGAQSTELQEVVVVAWVLASRAPRRKPPRR